MNYVLLIYFTTDNVDIQLDTEYNGYVSAGSWNYWHLHYFTDSPLMVTVQQLSEGDCDIYVKQNSDPTRIIFQITDMSTDPEFSITIQNPGDDSWHLGIYGWTACTYQIEATVVGKLIFSPLFNFLTLNNKNRTM